MAIHWENRKSGAIALWVNEEIVAYIRQDNSWSIIALGGDLYGQGKSLKDAKRQVVRAILDRLGKDVYALEEVLEGLR